MKPHSTLLWSSQKSNTDITDTSNNSNESNTHDTGENTLSPVKYFWDLCSKSELLAKTLYPLAGSLGFRPDELLPNPQSQL